MNLAAFQNGLARARCRGFTMIEIAISIGVIGFALVAIIGILPAGLTVQKDNRDDTVINQDANFFMQSIRAGAVVSNGIVLDRTLDFLSNYVEAITITNPFGLAEVYTNFQLSSDRTYTSGGAPNYFTTTLNETVGGAILGLLTRPKFYITSLPTFTVPGFQPITNYTRAWVRALNGSAMQQNGANSAVAFRYIMDVQITPHYLFPTDSTNWVNTTTLADYTIRSNRWMEANFLSQNLYDVELTFHWPVLASGAPGPNRQVFRSTIASSLAKATNGTVYYYFQPQTFTAAAAP
ncbi:MAG TPA: type II secretion system protein [Verrucomicrobiae bacterium]|jgi:type II secretory pathway pseudopilin PulG|nr:type II secretion system protein [Verrucomicrobiae bacterium]